MAATTEPTASRSAINVRHLQYGVNGAPEKRKSKTQPDRRRLLQECMRQLDAGWLAKQVSRNPSIVKEDSHLNYGFFNDGDGGWTEMTDADSIEDTVAYGDARVGSVHRKIHKNTFETTTIVSFLPKSLCQEIPDYYPVTRKNSKGEEKVVGHRSRWVPKDLDATKQYFEHLIEYLESNVLTGGHDAISGFAVNLDESVPHIHIMADTFAPDPAHDGWLRVEAQQLWGQHKDVTEQRVDEETGETREVKITGRTKMRRYQEGLREFMLERGYDIEAEPDPVRSRTSLSKDTYAAAQSAVLAAEEFGQEAGALYGEALNEAETAQVMADEAAKEMEAAKKLRDKADQQLEEARQTTERLTEEWERTERPQLVEEATAEARAEWESTERPQLVEEAREAGRQQALAEVRQEFDTTEKPRLVTQVENQAQKRWDEVTKPELVEKFNQQVNEVLMPGMQAEAKRDGKQAARQEVEAEMQEQYDASTQELHEAQQLRQEAERRLANLEKEFDRDVKPGLIEQAKEDGKSQARIDAEKAVEERRQVDLDVAAANRQEASEDRATVSQRLKDVQNVLAGLDALEAEMPDAAEMRREVLDSASKAYVMAAHDLGLHDRIMERSDKNYSLNHGYFATAHMQKSKDEYESESWGHSKARLTRSAAEIAAEVEKEKQGGDPQPNG